MKRFIFLLVCSSLAFIEVNSLLSRKCKEAERSDDGFVRLLENANCTMTETRKKVHEGFQNVRNFIGGNLSLFKEKKDKTPQLQNKETSIKENGYEGYDDQIDVRMLSDDDSNNNQLTNSRTTRDIQEDYEEHEGPGIETATDGDHTTIGFRGTNLFIAPLKCRSNQILVGGRCRTIHNDY